jgi:predicted P-loop ATPase
MAPTSCFFDRTHSFARQVEPDEQDNPKSHPIASIDIARGRGALKPACLFKETSSCGIEHYEISGYTTAKNLAQQLRHSAVVALLSKSLAEEENADQC